MMKRCPACRGRCRRISKFHIFLKVWIVETFVYPCPVCGGEGVITVGPIETGRASRKKARRAEPKACELCAEVLHRKDITRHHLRPRALNKRRDGPKAVLCNPCHTLVHKRFSLIQLNERYNTVEKLRTAVGPFANRPSGSKNKKGAGKKAGPSTTASYAPVVQLVEQGSSKPLTCVRIAPGAS